MAHVVLTQEPQNYTEYTQILGRSNRTDPNGIKRGTLLSSREILDQESLEQALKMKDNDLVLMHREQRNSLLKLNEFVKAKICEFNHSAIVHRAVTEYNKGKKWEEWMQLYDEIKTDLIEK